MKLKKYLKISFLMKFKCYYTKTMYNYLQNGTTINIVFEVLKELFNFNF